MYRIDNATAATVLPSPAVVGPNPNGYFTKGNPSTSTLATIVDDDFLNALQEEICYVIETAGGTLTKGTNTQLYDAIATLVQGIQRTTSASAANTYTATLTPAIGSYTAGLMFSCKFTNGNTGASTIDLNSVGAKAIKRLDGSALVSGDIYDGMTGLLTYDGTNMILLNVNQQRVPYASSTDSPNTYTAGLSIPIKSYNEGMLVSVKFTNANTGAATLNLNSVGAANIVTPDGSALKANHIVDGMVGVFVYDGTNFQLTNPASISKIITQTITATGTYTPSAGLIYADVEMVGGGGGGAGAATGNPAAGGGGAYGGYLKKRFTAAEIGADAAVTIGAAGAAGSAGANNGGTGGDSIFNPAGTGSTLTASGGAGGGAGVATSIPTIGGAGGIGGDATNGDINVKGAPGNYGFNVGVSGGGQVLAGHGGHGRFGSGGLGTQAPSTGQAGNGNGSGGAGGASNGTSARAGGAGTIGLVVVTEYCF